MRSLVLLVAIQLGACAGAAAVTERRPPASERCRTYSGRPYPLIAGAVLQTPRGEREVVSIQPGEALCIMATRTGDVLSGYHPVDTEPAGRGVSLVMVADDDGTRLEIENPYDRALAFSALVLALEGELEPAAECVVPAAAPDGESGTAVATWDHEVPELLLLGLRLQASTASSSTCH